MLEIYDLSGVINANIKFLCILLFLTYNTPDFLNLYLMGQDENALIIRDYSDN